ncbi:nitroreductase family protein [Zongyangia hominis]|uniref:Nitroreductase family protein n=1 Tax=Zongyangia hominis TaxID=2763677 RepID=A0A926IC62_9FIRM|nr:nitroreductase family protein [Zongyangia hominis]MBC8570887.1 nitroreductase family protein [Zongyangia hominis]
MLDVIRNRRSIRQYQNKPVPDDLVKELLTAGFYAPTGRRAKPWHFIVVNEPQKLQTMMKIHPYMGMLKTAPMAIIVCGDTSLSPDLWTADCAAATQNILLQAYDLGLGTCWCGIEPNEQRMDEFGKLFDLPEHVKVYSAIAVGFPDEEKPAPERYDESAVHRNQW